MSTKTMTEFLDVTLAAWTRRAHTLLAVADNTRRATYRAMADALVAQWNRPDDEGEDFTYRLLDVASAMAPPDTLLAVIDRLDWISGTKEKNEAELPEALEAPLAALAALRGL